MRASAASPALQRDVLAFDPAQLVQRLKRNLAVEQASSAQRPLIVAPICFGGRPTARNPECVGPAHVVERLLRDLGTKGHFQDAKCAGHGFGRQTTIAGGNPPCDKGHALSPFLAGAVLQTPAGICLPAAGGLMLSWIKAASAAKRVRPGLPLAEITVAAQCAPLVGLPL
jgi:hypothetical protein